MNDNIQSIVSKFFDNKGKQQDLIIGYYGLANRIKEVRRINLCLAGACMGGNIKFAKMLIRKGANDFDTALYGACLMGNYDMVKFISKLENVNWSVGIKGACRGGHLWLLKLISKKEERGTHLIEAYKGGHCDIIEFILKECDYQIFIHTNLLLAHEDKRIDVAKTLLKYTPHFSKADLAVLGEYELFKQASLENLNNISFEAFRGGNMQIINSLPVINPTLALNGACANGSLELVKYAVELGAKNYNDGLFYTNTVEIANYLMELGANNANLILKIGCITKNMDFINRALHMGVSDARPAIQGVCKNGDLELFKIIETNCKFSRNFALAQACEYGQSELYDYLYSRYDLWCLNCDNRKHE